MWQTIKRFFDERAERKRLKNFLQLVGLAHMQCALVEDQLKKLLMLLGELKASHSDVLLWLEDEPNFFRLINEAKKRFGLSNKTADSLHAFRQARNDFTHSIWRGRDDDLPVGDNLKNRTKDVIVFLNTAMAFSGLFQEFILKGLKTKLDRNFAGIEQDLEEMEMMTVELEKMRLEMDEKLASG